MKILHLSDPSHGWIDVTFGQEPDTCTLTVSDVPNDCLRDFAAATSRLLAGSVDEIVEFSLEPGFALCRLRRESKEVRVVVSQDGQSQSLFEAFCPLSSFANRLRSELLRIESAYTDLNGWSQPFPHREVANLG